MGARNASEPSSNAHRAASAHAVQNKAIEQSLQMVALRQDLHAIAISHNVHLYAAGIANLDVVTEADPADALDFVAHEVARVDNSGRHGCIKIGMLDANFVFNLNAIVNVEVKVWHTFRSDLGGSALSLRRGQPRVWPAITVYRAPAGHVPFHEQ
ncbi:hypothetical protein [Sphingomonas nostoxanthinifaciens]|nr:hypothetical protein [Sphingomonas nostoxanthinifaciens]UAK23832.1 hypothetical protein K8P63_15850 [Sphingomonas nostoxanthinifaciens]